MPNEAGLGKKRIVASQWGDGFGMASYGIAHLCLEGQLSIARSMKQTLARVFIDVIQAFPSMVVALTLRLQSRGEDTLAFFRSIGFAKDVVEQIIEDNAMAGELADVSDHVQAPFANFQENQ